MEPRGADLYEFVLHRKDQLKDWQWVFMAYPDLGDTYATNDLWSKHPSKADLWCCAGRTDDVIILSHGECLYPGAIELGLHEDPRIQSAVVGGASRKHPFVILELTGDKILRTENERQEAMDRIWPAVERVNKMASEYVSLKRELVIFSSPDKPVKRVAKITVVRKQVLIEYEKEVDAAYERAGLQ